jgi:hypothetical protein
MNECESMVEKEHEIRHYAHNPDSSIGAMDQIGLSWRILPYVKLPI